MNKGIDPEHGEDTGKMTSVERLLSDELARLTDRLAASVPEGGLARISATAHQRARLDAVEASLAAARLSVLESYARWTQAVDDVENMWALAAWRSTAEDVPAEPAARAA
jgi:hypothetical protein